MALNDTRKNARPTGCLTSGEVLSLTGLTFRMLDHHTRSGTIPQPTKIQNRRWWSWDHVRAIRAFQAFSGAGVKVASTAAKVAFEHPDATWLTYDGRDVVAHRDTASAVQFEGGISMVSLG